MAAPSPHVAGQVRYGSVAGRWVLVGTVLGSGLAAIDGTVVGIALPTIGRQMHASLGALQWVVTGYSLTLAAFLLPGGALGDRYGRRRVFSIGVAWFTAASAVCAVAPDAPFLVATRVLQGVGAALLTPGSLAIIEASFAEDDRSRAVGAWSGLGGVATAAGPLLGGYLIAAASWRWIFLINVPLGAAVLTLSVRHIPESLATEAARRLAVTGALLAVVALAAVVYCLSEGPELGWSSPGVVASTVVGVAAAAGFAFVEWTRDDAMLPSSAFRIRQFTATNAVTFVVYNALGGALFLLPVTLQIVDGYTPLDSGLSLLPLTAVMFALSSRSGRLAARIGPRLQMSVGPVLVGAGLILLERATTDRSYVSGVLPAILVFALGLAATVAPLTATALSALPARQAGLASAVNNDVARLGGLIAVAILPALAGVTGRSYLAPHALAAGFRRAMLMAGIWCAFGGVVAAVGVRHPGPRRAEEAVRHCALDAPPATAR